MNADEKILYAKVRLLMRHKFFGSLLLYFPLTKKNLGNGQVEGTMATDGNKIWWDEKFVEKIDKDECVGVVLHEIFHNYFKHFYRFRAEYAGGKNPLLLNMAMDYAINSIILNEMKSKDNLIKLPQGVLYDEKFKGWNAEKILNYLEKEKKKDKNAHDKRMEEAMGDGSGQGQFDNHEVSGQETRENIEKTKKDKGKSVDDQMQDIDKKAFKVYESLSGKEKGDVPDEMKRMIDEYFENLKGHINWKRFIRNKLQDIGRSQYTSIRYNRRHVSNGIYLPGLTGQKGKAAMALDTSGSIGEDEIKQFLGEIEKALTQFPSLEILTYGIDSVIHGKERIKGKRQFKPKNLEKVLTGGGGTSFIPVFKDLLAGKDKDIKLLFYFTDGYGDQEYIERECGGTGNWRTFWVVPESCKEVTFPFGEKIVMKDPK